tara:strand:- start:1327 stop:1470 length:144 start_codon:yes stop_codon:yes gene_type:complete
VDFCVVTDVLLVELQAANSSNTATQAARRRADAVKEMTFPLEKMTHH